MLGSMLDKKTQENIVRAWEGLFDLLLRAVEANERAAEAGERTAAALERLADRAGEHMEG